MTQAGIWPNDYRAAASVLLKAAEFADRLQRSPWDFAVEISELTKLGLGRTDLRWLLCDGLIEQAEEIRVPANHHRLFQPLAGLVLTNWSCFILTKKGRCAASHLAVQHASSDEFSKNSVPSGDRHILDSLSLKPCWNSELNRLLLGRLLVKQYRRPAPNQQLILRAFQEEDWPERIDDPLPPASDIEPQRRLHETVAGLNRHQTNPVLRFSGDGRGRGITWITLL